MAIKPDHKFLAVAVLLVGMAVLFAMSLRTPAQLRRDVADVDLVRDVQAQSQDILVTLLDLETSQRGYLLTLEASYLQPYRAGLGRLDAQIAGLSALTAADPEAAAQLERARGLIDTKRAELAQTLTLADTQGVGAAPPIVRNGSGQALMDGIRTALARVDAVEAAAQAQRLATRSASIERSARYEALLAAAIGVLLLALVVMVRRERALHERVRSADAAARRGLEQRVAQRTRELETTSRSFAASEARLRGIFETAVDAIITANEQQVIVQANPAAARLFRCPVEQMVGAPLERFIPQRARAQHRIDLQAFGAGAAAARHMGAHREVLALRSDGVEFPIEASISHVLVGDQRLFTVIHRDVSERRQAREQLLAGKLKLQAALSSMSDAVLITDSQGHFEEFNEAFVRFHRFKDAASCSRWLDEYAAILEVFGPDGATAPLDQWAVPRALRGETVVDAEYRLRRRDTGESWIGSYSFAPVRAKNGDITGSVMVCRDVTAVKLAQADLEDSHAALQRLIANHDKVQDDERARIARELHDDLQQTLAAVRIDLGELGERLAGSAVDQTSLLAELDGLSAQAIVSTRRIVGDLRPQILDDLGLVDALKSLATQFTQRTGVACTLDANEAIGDALLGAPGMAASLYRVIQEALNNAAKHADATRVQIRLAVLSATQISLSVVDNGRGIRAHDRRKRDSFGLLGMQERVRALGGVLRIERLAAGGTLLEALVPWGNAHGAGGDMEGVATAPEAVNGDDSAFGALLQDSSHGRLDAAPLPRLLTRTTTQSIQMVIDALVGNVAVLDREGTVRLVNRGWLEFADRNGSPGARGMGPGVNYLEVCRRSSATDESVRAVLQGLVTVIEGRVKRYTRDYPCHSPEEQRWFRMNAAAMSNGDVLVTHFLVTGTDPSPSDSPH